MRKHEKDFYSIEWDGSGLNEAIITFKYPVKSIFKKLDYDWYIIVAIEKADKILVDRHLLTGELLTSYRWAIREGYQHQLDLALQSAYDNPRNRNTIKGIQGYISKMHKLSGIDK